jgi:RimJ/RimL family protein N-acetyltransferase
VRTLSNFGIELTQLIYSDIELVRNWRNQDFIRNNMEYQEIITSEQQISWFEKISQSDDYYFMIKTQNQAIGLAHINGVNPQDNSAHVGIFIGESLFVGTGISFKVSLLIFQFSFEELKLKVLFAKIKNDHQAAIAYNQFLGFELAEEGPVFSMWKLTKKGYDNAQIKLKQLI